MTRAANTAARLAVALSLLAATSGTTLAASGGRSSLEQAAEGVVKIYGAGGLAGIEAYQSGMIITGQGHVLTTNSLVLDQGEVTVVRHNGDRYSGTVIGADPVVDIAIIKIDPAGQSLRSFDLRGAAQPQPGQRVFALANVFGIATGDEPVTLMRSAVAAVAPLRAQRGALERIDGGEVYILDAVTSNPGAAGGVVVTPDGRLVGMLGRELKSRITGAWLSYALPASELRVPVERIMQGHQSASSVGSTVSDQRVDLLKAFGFTLLPDIVPRTPPYVDHVRGDSPAAQAGLKADDLVVTIDGLVTATASEVNRLLARDAARPIELLVQRGEELVEIVLPARRQDKPDQPETSSSQ